MSSCDIKVYPNPTDGILGSEMDAAFEGTGDLNIEVFDCFGKLFERDVMSKTDAKSKTLISLEKYAFGEQNSKK